MSRSGLVLYSFKKHKTGYTEALFDRLAERAQLKNMSLQRGALKELHIVVKNNSLTVFDPIHGKDLSEYSMVYLELWYKCPQQGLATAVYCERNNIPYMSSELRNLIPDTKVGEIAVLADNDIPLPDTFTSSLKQIKKIFKQGIQEPFGYPFILKAANGYGGKHNFLIRTRKQLLKILKENKERTFIAQQFIPNDCDYRCLVLGGEVKLVLKRSRTSEDTHLNNTSTGAEGEVVPLDTLPQKAIQDVQKAARVVGRAQFSGVDLIFNKETGQHYILEVNQTPQIEIGAEVEQKMDALLTYLQEIGGKRWQ